MRKLAKIRTAGTLIAMMPPLLWCGVATSQTSTVENHQVQLGDVFATQTLDVVSPSDSSTAVTTALGNGMSASTDGTAMQLRSTQSLQGNVTGSTTVNGYGYMGAQAAYVTTATGNAATVATTNGGYINSSLSQTAGAVTVRPGTGIYASGADATDISGASQSTVNSIGLGADHGSTLEARVDQTSAATAEGSTGVQLKYASDQANFAGTTVNNNLTASGANGSTMDLDVHQSATGNHTQGTAFLSAGTVQTANTAGTAIANNVSINNNGGPLAVKTVQDNTSYVRGQTANNANLFGSLSASAYGVGNSVLAGEIGGHLDLDNHQTEAGGVDAIAQAGGGTGYDITANATAIGNAVTGYACTECGGVINVGNNQVNSSGVSATTTVGVTGTSRSITGTATAVGNTATFYVSKPGG